jgi:hypothetical protein
MRMQRLCTRSRGLTTNDIVDRASDALWEAVVAQRRGISVPLHDEVVNGRVDLGGRRSGLVAGSFFPQPSARSCGVSIRAGLNPISAVSPVSSARRAT